MDLRQERLKESLLILEGLNPAQRRAWIKERLSDDPDLARDVTRLMSVDLGSDDALAPLVAPPEGFASGGLLPRQIGPFVVDGLIAQGGMGTVYRAHQVVPVRRRAAVKVLRAEFSTQQLLARFEDERVAIAKMEHRNVARMLDAGTDAHGRSYIAMELVEGPPITEYASLHNLSLRQRLELFVQACRGVQHAHNRGILHRDLKPSNILVTDEDAQPVAKVIDFGLAKLLATNATRSGQTLAGQLLGTIGYMSPEQTDQLKPDADVRSDVYSLGVVLYELLTGALPVPTDMLDGMSVGDVRALISAHPRVPPSRFSPPAPTPRGVRDGIPAELDCLVLKASHPDPAQRYPSPSDLAEDIERFLSGRTILARPPSTWYRTQKFVQRHKLPVASGIIVVGALVGGLLAAGIGLRRAVIDRRAAETALARSQEDAARADQALARAEEVAAYLRELLMRAHPARLGPNATFEQILKASAADFLAQPPSNSIVRAEVASALAEPLYLTGDYATVESLLLPQIESLAGETLPRARSLRTSIMIRLGYVASRMSRTQDAEQRFVRATEFARDSDSPQLIFQATGALAQTYSAGGNYDRAIEMLLLLLESDVAKSDELLRASALSNLGVAYGRKGAAAQGLPYAREGYEIRARLAPRDPNTHNMGWQLGISYMENDQLDQAVEIFQRNYAASVDASGDDHPDAVSGAVLLHYARARRGDGPDVIAPMLASVEHQRRIGIPPQQIAQTRMYVAGALMYTGQRERALAEANAALAELETTSTRCGRGVVTVLLQIGTILSAAGAPTESLAYLERAFECTQVEPTAAPFATRIAGAIVSSYQRVQDDANVRRWREIQAGLQTPPPPNRQNGPAGPAKAGGRPEPGTSPAGTPQ
ncbi:MAG: serine/threonine-protein kinase [Planctomycetota bacterium]|nr:serine/threonine-protein kinase [Planctomycetota bacterium]